MGEAEECQQVRLEHERRRSAVPEDPGEVRVSCVHPARRFKNHGRVGPLKEGLNAGPVRVPLEVLQ
eukprot:27326-Eustigmatos_ZCMA.PRE.1